MKPTLKIPKSEDRLSPGRLAGLAGLAAVGGALLVPSVAHAQSQGVVELQRYRPVTAANRGFGLEGTKPLGHLKLAVALDVNYAASALRVTSLAAGTSTTKDAVRSAAAADLMMAIGLLGRFELAVALPVTLSQAGDAPLGAAPTPDTGVGDARFTVRARLWEQGADGWSLGAGLTATSPFGQTGTYVNNPGLTVEPRLVLAHKRRSLQWGARLGMRLRESTSLLGTPVRNEVTFGAGADKRFGRAFHGIVELLGSTPATDGVLKRRLTPLEALVGGRYQMGQFNVGAAAGLGVVSGVGSPAWRVLATLAWTNDPPDADRDGLVDTKDACPDDPEDKDGFEDLDGCPDPDNDKDGILDALDQCPSDPEDLDGFEDEDGCPDLDNDKDGIADATDKCPNEPETINEFQDEDGCPDEVPATDKDGDGILDRDDKCPDDAEDKDGFEDEDGCPDPDNDKDGILDADDKCPAQAETINGRQDDDGCPDEGAPQVRIGEKELETLQAVFFTTNRFRVRHRFWNILDQIALTLKAHPEIGRCAVEGHADATGPDDWNQRLSVMRAETVVAYLVGKGVDPKRLSALGQGGAKPWADNETDEGRARNRRVMFHIEGVFSSRLPPNSKKVFDEAELIRKQKAEVEGKDKAEVTPGEKGTPQETPPAKQTPKMPGVENGPKEAPAPQTKAVPGPTPAAPADKTTTPKRSSLAEPAGKAAPPTDEPEIPTPPPAPVPAKPPAPPPAGSAKTLREAVRLPDQTAR